MRPFSAWLARACPRTLEDCTPHDIMVYMELVYLRTHQGSTAASEERYCAPGTVEGTLSHMGQVFKQMGRPDRWNCFAVDQRAASRSNPVDSQDVEDYRKSYRRQAVSELHFREVSATPVTEAQIVHVLEGLAALVRDGCDWLAVAVAARDGAVLSIMWVTMMRGHEVGCLQLASLRLPDGSSAWAKLAPVLLLRPGDEWFIKPRSTKTEAPNVVQPRHVRHGDVTFCLEPAVWVHRVLLTAGRIGQPIADYLFRPMRPDRQGFQEAPLQSTTLNQMFKKRLTEAGMLAGQTPHGIRRGAIQAGVAAGRSQAQVMEQAHMRTPRVFERYVDPFRHIRDQ